MDPNNTDAHIECKYCGVDEVTSLAQCSGCKVWLCNGQTRTKGSHIVTHMVKRRHKELALHKNGSVGGTAVECYTCGSKNVFKLGYVSAQNNTVVVFLCRTPCAVTAISSGDITGNPSLWKPVISDFKLVSWLVEEPSYALQRVVTMAKVDEIEFKEDTSKTSLNAKRDQEDEPATEEFLEQLPLVFPDAKTYGDLYKTFLDKEAASSETTRSEYVWTDVKVEVLPEQREGATIIKFKTPPTDFKIIPGDTAIFETQFESWFGGGYEEVATARVNHNSGPFLYAELQRSDFGTPDPSGYRLRFKPSNVPILRMKAALKAFAKGSSIHDSIKKSILGIVPESALGPETSPEDDVQYARLQLNRSQREAVKSAINSQISLIQGPPGTGKTVTTVALIMALARNKRILAAAPSNTVADQLASRLGNAGINVLRVVSASREITDADVLKYTLRHKVAQALDPESRKLYKADSYEDGTGVRQALVKKVNALERKFISEASIICVTCIGAGDARLKNEGFDTVIIDEATQSLEPESLVAIMHKCKQLVLVGDHKQLGPVVTDLEASRAGLSRSYFERLVELGIRPNRLTVQYRMHPSLSRFPSDQFYEGTLQNAAEVKTRSDNQRLGWLWPNPDKRMVFWAFSGKEEIGPEGTSYLNQLEASGCRELLTKLISSGVDPADIGIITPYKAQRTYLREHLALMGEFGASVYDQIEIESVDAFQGREKGYIILSCVRSNVSQGIGFLSDGRRLNVAITRAKHGLIIIGNPQSLSRNVLWSDLLEFYRASGCLVQGTLSFLTQYTMPLFKPRNRRGEAPVAPVATDVEASSKLMEALSIS